jgi:hypothetical protein
VGWVVEDPFTGSLEGGGGSVAMGSLLGDEDWIRGWVGDELRPWERSQC